MICSGCTASFFHSGLPLTAAAHHAPAASLIHYQGPCHICRLLATDYHAATAKHPAVLEKFDVDGPAYKGTLREQSVPGTFILYLYRVWEYDVDPSQVVDVKQIMISVFPWEDGLATRELDHGDTTGSPQAMRSIKHWMQVCKEEHEGCRKLNSKDSSPSSLPTRLLDIRPNPTDTIKLISSATLPSPIPYMTLSYCWGTAPATSQLRTTRATLATHQDRGIPFSSLPLTFQQTIQIARLLSISHLWIDALCIIQSDAEDWHAEAPRMQDVYGYSHLNVSASASTSPDGGLFRGRDAQHLDISLVPGPIGDRGVGQRFAVVHKDYWEAQLLESKLYSRAWVFQERMLSPRLLHFTDEQIFFECPCLQACEAFPTGLPTQLLTRPKRDLQWKRELQRGTFERTLTDQERRGIPFEHFWTTAVRSYSSCDLTNGADKIVALSGISTLMARAVEDVDEYLSGMWRFMLEEQLAWRVVEARQHNGKPARRVGPEAYRAPSWSWASVDGVIDMPLRVKQEREYKLSILQCGEREVGSGFNGEMKKALGSQRRFLLIEGLVFRLDFCKELDEGSEWVLVDPVDRTRQMAEFRASYDVGRRGEKAGDVSAALVMVVAYTKNSQWHSVPGYSGKGIIIEPTGDSAGKDYQRIGAVEFSKGAITRVDSVEDAN